MQSPRPRGMIRPKISTMPRNQSEASIQLDLYKLVTEKQRIEQELRLVEQRNQQLNQRLSILVAQISDAQEKFRELSQNSPTTTPITPTPTRIYNLPNLETFETVYLEY
ncbi:MAG: gas vesicle protein [Actinomycetota bacterium]